MCKTDLFNFIIVCVIFAFVCPLSAQWFSEDFSEGDTTGWSVSFNDATTHVISFPSYTNRGKVLRFEGQWLDIYREDFTFPNDQYVVEFDARLVSSGHTDGGSGSDHILSGQYYDSENLRHFSRRANEYDDLYVWEPGPTHGQVFLNNPTTPMTDWTTYRTVRDGDFYEFFYSVPGSNSWTSAGTYTAEPGSMSSGGQFYIHVGGTTNPGVYEIDSISVIPEPATRLLFGLGCLVLRRKR